MNSKVRRLHLCNVSALLAGLALPNAALAHPAIARSLDLHAFTKLAQYAIRKNRPYPPANLYAILGRIAVSKSAQLQTVNEMVAASNAKNMLIASSTEKLEQQIQAIQLQAASRQTASKSSIGLLNSRAKVLRSQLHLARNAKLLSSLHQLQD